MTRRAAAPAPPTDQVCARWKECRLAQQVFVVHNQMMRCADRLVAHHGLTASRWLMLGALERYDDPPTLSELSSDALLSVQNVSRMVASMEREGLVQRFSVPGKGRSVFVRMTDHGLRIKQAAKADAERFSDHFLAGFAEPALTEAERVFDRLIANLERFEQELTSSEEA